MNVELRISTDRRELDVDLIHRYLSEESYWARSVPREILQRALQHSICFGGFLDGRQVAFARVVTDRATYAALLDVFVVREHRGRGHAQALMRAVMAHPDLEDLRRFMLTTADAHGLYAKFGFVALTAPDRHMERYDPELYRRMAGSSTPD